MRRLGRNIQLSEDWRKCSIMFPQFILKWFGERQQIECVAGERDLAIPRQLAPEREARIRAARAKRLELEPAQTMLVERESAVGFEAGRGDAAGIDLAEDRDVGLVERAYLFSAAAHRGQKRLSGDEIGRAHV